MKHLIVQSVNKKFYNLIRLDKKNNQTLITSSEDLSELQGKQPDAPVIQETEIADHHYKKED